MDGVEIERRGRVAVVRFSRGDGRNAMSRRMIRALTAAADSFADDLETSAVVLTGGEGCFSVGADLKDPERAGEAEAGLMARRHAAQLGRRLCQAWARVEPLTISAIEGWCIGGGVALSAALDLRVAAEGARFSIPEIERGMNMSWGSLPRLVALMGPARAKRLAILAERIDAATAHRLGLIDELAPEGAALDAALRLAERAAALPPAPVRMIKRGCDAAAHALAEAVSAMDADQFTLTTYGEDFAEGVQSFLERRPPSYTGR